MTSGDLYNILVTGGAGFIGTSLIPILLNRGYHVTVADHLSVGKIDLANYGSCKRAMIIAGWLALTTSNFIKIVLQY